MAKEHDDDLSWWRELSNDEQQALIAMVQYSPELLTKLVRSAQGGNILDLEILSALGGLIIVPDCSSPGLSFRKKKE